ncbi:PIN domain-containing protein [Candidatus Tokpelaia sp.]|uniref:PIN domain-containing protein n=1 Tax=Candidatus Tokpelaia sp. TaxID=2233777 RepID=UPI00123A1B85|nr:PIN domain-containing protein [Candidatus Tokpelaia sp.]KAA6405320.1 hypothetical protein DPQ22_05600 [Candidatus Tokpelaia sp.]
MADRGVLCLCKFFWIVILIFLLRASITDNTDFQFLFEIIKTNKISILMTEMTFHEVVKHLVSRELDKLRPLCELDFRYAYKRLTGALLSDCKKSALKEALKTRYNDYFKGVCASNLKAQFLDGAALSPALIFSAYAKGEGFFSSEAKKEQFPDAFNFETLKAQATRDNPLILVSKDKDFDNNYVKSCPHISVVETFSELFSKLGLKAERDRFPREKEVFAFLTKHTDAIKDSLDTALSGADLFDDSLPAEHQRIYINNFSAVEFPQDNPEMSVFHEGSLIRAELTLTARANVYYRYTDYDSLVWDSEDKLYIPAGDETEGETEIDLTLDITLSLETDKAGKPRKIKGLSVLDNNLNMRGNNHCFVTLFPQHDEYGYK